ncbi:LutC/YkgG family protein [Nocardioides iriomotensis]|uniref:Lactate utilization protein C n=1 Tax=Nocardioides iriomotensis TaxID=715784 RepID=A0A4Q5J5A3_9ACTN|nr:lactate utilization protein C [Nocardioides iriomotensis]RYU13724.1 lactate utilization protein C [Nocardioides iriomotensis]
MTTKPDARSEILARVRGALAGTDVAPVQVPRGYRSRPERLDRSGLLTRFVERVEDYRAQVTRCAEADVIRTVASILPTGARVVLPPGLLWDVPGVADDGFTATDLDGYAAVVTAATVGIAETGTIVLTHGPGEGRRALSLVPDLHVCVVRADQVVADVPDAVRLLDAESYRGRPQTWISGPSATSDIELDRVEGVHGPRTLHVVLVS